MSFSTRDLLVLPSNNPALASILVIGATIAAVILLRGQAILGLLISRVAHVLAPSPSPMVDLGSSRSTNSSTLLRSSCYAAIRSST